MVRQAAYVTRGENISPLDLNMIRQYLRFVPGVVLGQPQSYFDANDLAEKELVEQMRESAANIESLGASVGLADWNLLQQYVFGFPNTVLGQRQI